QTEQLDRTAPQVVRRLPGRMSVRVPVLACQGAGLIRPGFIIRPDRQPQLLTNGIGVLDQLFFASVSGSVTHTAPSLPLRNTRPVSHQVRLRPQRQPAPCSTARIV